MAFTVVFEGVIADFKGNPLQTDTPFGRPIAISVGNALDEIEGIHEIEATAEHLLQVIRRASDG